LIRKQKQTKQRQQQRAQRSVQRARNYSTPPFSPLTLRTAFARSIAFASILISYWRLCRLFRPVSSVGLTCPSGLFRCCGLARFIVLCKDNTQGRTC
jgi:hypothetical protein